MIFVLASSAVDRGFEPWSRQNKDDTTGMCNYINTTGATNGVGTAYPSGTPAPVFSGDRVTLSLVLCVCFFRSLFVHLYSISCTRRVNIVTNR
jgi:hypothetical protein